MPLLAKPIWLAARFWLSCIPCLKIAVFRNFSAHMVLDISKYEPWIQNKRFFRNLCWGFCNIEKGECKRFYYFNYFSSPKSPSPCYDLKFEPKVNTRYNIWDQIFDPNIWCLSIFSMHFFLFYACTETIKSVMDRKVAQSFSKKSDTFLFLKYC